MRINESEHIPEISCRNARMERPHKPHVYDERLYDNAPQKTTAKCWGYPSYREDGHDDEEFKSFNEAVKGLKNKPSQK